MRNPDRVRAISVRRTVYDQRIGVVVLWRPIARSNEIIGEKALTGLTICVCDTFSRHNHGRHDKTERTCRCAESAGQIVFRQTTKGLFTRKKRTMNRSRLLQMKRL